MLSEEYIGATWTTGPSDPQFRQLIIEAAELVGVQKKVVVAARSSVTNETLDELLVAIQSKLPKGLYFGTAKGFGWGFFLEGS